MNIHSPQFKTELKRKLKNIIPNCTVEFVPDVTTGIGFRVLDKQNRYRSNIVRIYRYTDSILEKENLIHEIVNAGVPSDGLPQGF